MNHIRKREAEMEDPWPMGSCLKVLGVIVVLASTTPRWHEMTHHSWLHGTGGVGDDMRKFLEAAQEDAVEAQEARKAIRCCSTWWVTRLQPSVNGVYCRYSTFPTSLNIPLDTFLPMITAASGCLWDVSKHGRIRRWTAKLEGFLQSWDGTHPQKNNTCFFVVHSYGTKRPFEMRWEMTFHHLSKTNLVI